MLEDFILTKNLNTAHSPTEMKQNLLLWIFSGKNFHQFIKLWNTSFRVQLIFLNLCCENLYQWSILSQPYVGWIRMKICGLTYYPAYRRSWLNVWNYSVAGPTWIYLFDFINYNRRAKCEICSKLTIETPEPHQWRCSGVFIVYFEQVNTRWNTTNKTKTLEKIKVT